MRNSQVYLTFSFIVRCVCGVCFRHVGPSLSPSGTEGKRRRGMESWCGPHARDGERTEGERQPDGDGRRSENIGEESWTMPKLVMPVALGLGE